MTEVLTRLLRQADLFDDPGAYEAGVHDTFAALTEAGRAPGDPPQDPSREGAGRPREEATDPA